jgi:type IV pilus assembly protein PilP
MAARRPPPEESDVRVLTTASVGVLAVLLALGCSGGDKPAPSRAAQQPSAQARPPKPLPPEQASHTPYRYNPSGKRDPFRSLAREMGLKNTLASTPLERFDLSQISLTGIVWSSERPRALVKDPAGKGYVVAVGTPIGKNEGRILKIEDNRVVVKETYVDYLGKATTKDIELRLHREQGG